ncbi:hypothetical protein DY000_02039972 [Brassica cretica]|uniref:Methyltransferase n=1 Tax=Brassica cretica TaxID=69181 RepID=A0ABQ7BCM8_BRACR|nr:hypothetical protein DY000_02039972 [Brassica cretica]
MKSMSQPKSVAISQQSSCHKRDSAVFIQLTPTLFFTLFCIVWKHMLGKGWNPETEWSDTLLRNIYPKRLEVINTSNVKWGNISVQGECPSPVNQKRELNRVSCASVSPSSQTTTFDQFTSNEYTTPLLEKRWNPETEWSDTLLRNIYPKRLAVINTSNVKWGNISVQDECPSPVNQESEITRVR